MYFIKDVRINSYGKRCSIRTDIYSHNLAHIEEIFEEIKKDFPKIDRCAVDVVIYGGIRIKHILGLEFNVPIDQEIPKNYLRVSELEPTL